MLLSKPHLAHLCRSRGTSVLAPALAPCSGANLREKRGICGLALQKPLIPEMKLVKNDSIAQNKRPTSSSLSSESSSFSSHPLISSSSSSSSLSPSNRRGFHASAVDLKGVNPPILDNRNIDIDIDPDEIEFVGRKLRRFQMTSTGFCDPLPSEVEPSPLHLVTLVRPYSGNTWWIKKILWEFGLYRNRTRTKVYPEYQKAIVPNTPENNQKLAKIKHCVRIDRMTFPYGYPETEEDLKHMRIGEHGEVTFVKNVESHVLDDGTVTTVPLGVPRETLPEELDDETIRLDCFRKLINYEFLDEYHPEYENRDLGQGHFPGMKVYWEKNKPPISY